MKNSIYTRRIASETFETSIIKTEEAFLFVKAAMESGVDIETAYDDMKMIDDILHIKHLHFVVHGIIKKTKTGNLRKGTSLYDAINDVINGRLNK